ncbi:MAG TPA: PrgI family protein [Candidatus Saccharimonadales bacterium]|nr:PrgI family protein [Candidatus Saccharimonadales bacterium]
MAVYKVIQDIEAEDHLLGPLTLKGFVYAAAAALLGFVNFRLLISEALGPLKWVFILLFFFPMILFAVLASPLGREQPTEVWLLARIRFLLKPKKRIWSQIGLSQLIHITVPKKEDKHLTKDLTQTEVTSRLQALAQTLDSHGWAIKNVAVNLNSSPNYLLVNEDDSDRLVATRQLVQAQPLSDVKLEDDILDETNNPTAQKFDDMMIEAEEDRKRELQMKLEEARSEALITDHTQADEKTSDADKMLAKMHERARVYGASADEPTDEPAVTPEAQTVKMELAQSGSAFSVATLANLANRDSGEVVVSLR